MKRIVLALVGLCLAASVASAQPVPPTWRPPTGCSTSDYIKFNGTSWVCGTGPVSSLTNSAGANVIPKSNGTNLVASSVSDDGTSVSTGEEIRASNGIYTISNTNGFNSAGTDLRFRTNGIDGQCVISSAGLMNCVGGMTENSSPVLSGAITANTIPKGSGGNLADSGIHDNASAIGIDHNEFHFLDATNASGTGYINFNGYNFGVTQFRDLIVANGKGAAVATFTGSTKATALSGDLTVFGSTTLGDTPASDTTTINSTANFNYQLFAGDTASTSIANNLDILTIGQTGDFTSSIANVKLTASGTNTTTTANTTYTMLSGADTFTYTNVVDPTTMRTHFIYGANLSVAPVMSAVCNTASETGGHFCPQYDTRGFNVTATGPSTSAKYAITYGGYITTTATSGAYTGTGLRLDVTNNGGSGTGAAYGVDSHLTGAASAGNNSIAVNADVQTLSTANYGFRSSVSGAGTTNYGAYLDAANASTNIALKTENGNVILNNTSGTTTINGDALLNSTKNKGAITLSGGTGTATVTSGAICVCTDRTANVSVKCAVATTTLTATGTGTDSIAYVCF